MSILVTYDISDKWDEVKAAALKSGFGDSILTLGNGLFKLPNTCLMSSAISTEKAIEEFVALVRSVDSTIKISRAAAFDWGNCSTHSDIKSLGLLGQIIDQYKP